jgi:hypothetical protein
MGLEKLPEVVNGHKWELYNIADDYSEDNDLAAKMPDKLREMQELFFATTWLRSFALWRVVRALDAGQPIDPADAFLDPAGQRGDCRALLLW